MKKQDDDEGDNHDGGGNSDFVIREGLPALYLPESGFCKPWLDGDEPIPLLPFASFQNAVNFDSHLSNLLKDCELVFTARTKETHEAYSSGATFFVPCTMKPRCALEGLAMLIFEQHTKHLPMGIFRPECSGAEWWTLILEQDDNDDDDDDDDDEVDEVGMHFDADYGLEDQVKNLMIHPRLSTVTYLSNVGVPTLVLDKRSPQPKGAGNNSNNSSTTSYVAASLNGCVQKGWLSSPSIGKHISFDGRLLHGAPGAFFPAVKNKEKHQSTSSTQHLNKKLKTEDTFISNNNKRVTFLVNIWLNHCPLDAEILDQDVCDQLDTPWDLEHGTQQKDDVVASENSKRKQNNDKPLDDVVFQWRTTQSSNNDSSISSGDMNINSNGVIAPDEIETFIIDATKEQSQSSMVEEAVLCHHNVTFSLCSKTQCKEVAAKVGKNGSSVQIEFKPDVFQIIVGDYCNSDDDEEDDDE